MRRILPVLALVGVLVLGVLAAKVRLRNPDGSPPTQDVAEIRGEEKKGDLQPAEETGSRADQQEEAYEIPSGASKVPFALKQGSPAREVESTETVESGSRRETVRRESVVRSPAGPSTRSQNKSKAVEQAQEENQRSPSILSPEQQRKLMWLYIQALTHLRE